MADPPRASPPARRHPVHSWKLFTAVELFSSYCTHKKHGEAFLPAKQLSLWLLPAAFIIWLIIGIPPAVDPSVAGEATCSPTQSSSPKPKHLERPQPDSSGLALPMALPAACSPPSLHKVVNHGIAHELLDEMEKLAREFFMLPLEEKEKYPMAPGGIQGYGHAFVFSEDQKLDWCNMLALGVEPASIRQPKLWPMAPAGFRETLEAYSAEVRKLCGRLLVHIAETLGLAPATFGDMFGEAVQAVRMNFYPPCPRPELVMGLSAHSDGSAVTVLQQDMSCAGLQVRSKAGAWVPVHPVPHALVVNLGDTLEVLTNGRYKSVEHRAVVNGEQDRLSVVTFYAPAYDVELGPLPEFVTDEAPCQYRRFNHGEYSRHYVTSRLEGKKTLEFAKINPPAGEHNGTAPEETST